MTPLHHTAQASQHLIAAGHAFDQDDPATGYSHLLEAERAITAAKILVWTHHPQAAIDGVSASLKPQPPCERSETHRAAASAKARRLASFLALGRTVHRPE